MMRHDEMEEDPQRRDSIDVESRTVGSTSDPNRLHDVDSASQPSGNTSAAVDPAVTLPQGKEPDVVPDGGYGWVIVVSCFLINAHTWGLNSTYGVFLAHYLANNSYAGATALSYAFVGGLAIAMCNAVSPAATISSRVLGTRPTLLIGVFLQTVALLGASWSTKIWQLFLSQGVCFGMGMGFLFVGSVPIIPQWFEAKRSFAMSISAAGSGIGGLVYSLAAQAMIQELGLGWAFRILAIVSCGVNFVCTLLMRNRNKQIGTVTVAFDVKLLRRPEFLLLLGWGMFSLLGYIVLLYSLPNYASSVGLTASQGSVIGALLNLGQGIGRPLIGYYSDSFGRLNIALLGTFLPGLFGFVIWIFAKSYGILMFYSLLCGCFAGTFWTTIAPVSAEVVGLKVLPSALSLIWVSLIIPAIFAEPIALGMKQKTGNVYLHAQIFTGFMYIAAALCLWFLRVWKISEVDAAKNLVRAEREKQSGEERINRLRLERTVSVAASARSVAKGLFSLRRV